MQRLDDRYSLGEQIGQGGVGQVYLGRQEALDRPVAIKILRPELVQNRAAAARFEREARTTCRLHHPNVVTVIDVGRAHDGAHFLVMEYLEGETLADRLRRDGPCGVEQALSIARQIARGMGAGQGVGLVHRDLKPENIYLLEGDHVKILDFGLATLLESSPDDDEADDAPPIDSDSLDGGVDDSLSDLSTGGGRLTMPGTLLGTPRYMAPEQVLGWGVDHRTDLYAFGCILYEVLTGRSPYDGPGPTEYMRQHLHQAAPPLARTAPHVPRALARIVEKLLEKAPASRFADWPSLSEALRAVSVQEQAQPRDDLLHTDEQPVPEEPYRFLKPFTAANRLLYFGRQADARRFRQVWEGPRTPLVVLSGASGVGKSSFLGARVIPGLQDTGHGVVRVGGSAEPLVELAATVARTLARGGEEALDRPLPELIDALVRAERRPLAIVMDQLEEVFTSGSSKHAGGLQAGIAAILGSGDQAVRFVLSIREDYYGALLRSLHPLPVDEICRTLSLRSLEAVDLAEALEAPGREGLPVAYRPFAFDPGLVDEIVADLLDDSAGEVGPRVQAVGARLWQMIDAEGSDRITREHYRSRLGGARGILARVLDEAIEDLALADRAVAKAMLGALTNLPGSPTSRPAPEAELVAGAADTRRRSAVLHVLENRWRVVHGYVDPRWPGQRAFRIAHEALVARIQDYGQQATEQNRARQVFQQGLSLWLQSGCSDAYVLPEEHFDEVQSHIEDLVLRTRDERDFYELCVEIHNEGWLDRHNEERRRKVARRLQLTLVPAVLVGLGFVLGQVPVDFMSIQVARIKLMDWADMPAPDLSGARLRHADLAGLELRHAKMADSDLRDARFVGADLQQASFVGAQLDGVSFERSNLKGADLTGARLRWARFYGSDLRQARLDTDLEGADFTGALYDRGTTWGTAGRPPAGALGPDGFADGADAPGVVAEGLDLTNLSAVGANFSGASFDRSSLQNAHLDKARLVGASLKRARLAGASLRDAALEKANLSRADLDMAQLKGADLAGANLVGTNLRTAQGLSKTILVGAIADPRTQWPPGFSPEQQGVVILDANGTAEGAALEGLDLRGVKLPGINLRSADLAGAVLSQADLREANLAGASLAGSNLAYADLQGAELCGADLSGADTRFANFDGATACSSTLWPQAGAPEGIVLVQE